MAFIEFLLCTHFLYPGPHRFSSVTCVAHLWFLLILGKGLPKFDSLETSKSYWCLFFHSCLQVPAISEGFTLKVLCKKPAMLYFTSASVLYNDVCFKVWETRTTYTIILFQRSYDYIVYGLKRNYFVCSVYIHGC